jgi:hypothetical protein
VRARTRAPRWPLRWRARGGSRSLSTHAGGEWFPSAELSKGGLAVCLQR